MTAVTLMQRPAEWRASAMTALEASGVAALAGLIAGMVVAGLGGRLVMRVAGAMSDPTLVGTADQNGNIVGQITFGGTLFLVIAGGLQGFVGALVLALVRPWIRPLGRWGGLAFGLAVLAALGQIVIDASNFEFAKLGVAAVNVVLFALLFPVFGVLCAFALTRIEGAVRGAPAISFWGIAMLFGQLLVSAVPVVALSAGGIRLLMGAVELPSTSSDLRGLLPVYFAAVAIGARLVLGPEFTDARSLAPRVRLATYALLLAPVVLGIPHLITAVRFILRG